MILPEVERVDPNALALERLTWVERLALKPLGLKKRVEGNALHFTLAVMREYPGRLYHRTPGWVKDGALFHLRIRADRNQPALIAAALAVELLHAVRREHEQGHWWCELFLVMPDHAHAIMAFPREQLMSEVIRNWKRGTARIQRVRWQDGYFDHRLRDEKEARETWDYIRRNPVVKNLCAAEEDWSWWWSGIVENPRLRLDEQVERVAPNAISGVPPPPKPAA